MIPHTDALLKMKGAIQDEFETVILLCHAVPALNAYIKAVRHPDNAVKKLPDPHHFVRPVPIDRLEEAMPRYRKVLGRLVYIASYTYFESYFKELLDELSEFHGGWEAWEGRARSYASGALREMTEAAQQARSKLQESPKKGKAEKYSSNQATLKSLGYPWPHQLLSPWAVRKLAEARGDLKANDIPPLASDALGVPLTDEDVAEFRRIQSVRNALAHGNLADIDLSAAIEDSKILRGLAIKIDKHVCLHYLLVEPAAGP